MLPHVDEVITHMLIPSEMLQSWYQVNDLRQLARKGPMQYKTWPCYVMELGYRRCVVYIWDLKFDSINRPWSHGPLLPNIQTAHWLPLACSVTLVSSWLCDWPVCVLFAMAAKFSQGKEIKSSSFYKPTLCCCVLDGYVWDVTAADSCQANPNKAFITHYCFIIFM